MKDGEDVGLDGILDSIGRAGMRISEIDASEGAAGNISVCLRGDVDPGERFPIVEEVELPSAVPELAGATFIVTGSGRRLRELPDDPEGSLACIVVDEGGATGRMMTSSKRRFARVTTEFNSHLAVHYDRVLSGDLGFHAVLHAQPPHLTYISHLERYQDEERLNHRLLRWQPETIVQLPEGIGFIPFQVPGSGELMAATTGALGKHRIVVWARHGVVARSGVSVMQAVDLVEYAEAAARYEYLNIAAGEPATGFATDEILAICDSLGIPQTIFGEGS